MNHWRNKDSNREELFATTDEPIHTVNPATGLPMLNDCVDVAGNPFGIDNSHNTFESPCDSSVTWDPPPEMPSCD